MDYDLQTLTCISEDINLDDYINFREYVRDHMDSPEWLRNYSKNELEDMLKNNAKIWLYYLDNQPICSMMTIASTKEKMQEYDVNFNYQDVIFYGTMMVHPDYVGHGLQLQMLKELDNYSIKNNYKYLLGTIHPDNSYSINNFVKSGYQLLRQKEFARGLRYIYIKYLSK